METACVIGPAQYATVYTRCSAANSLNVRLRLKAENDRFRQEVALLKEEIRIKDAPLLCLNPRCAGPATRALHVC